MNLKAVGALGLAVVLAMPAFEVQAVQAAKKSAKVSPLIARFLRAGGEVPCAPDAGIAPAGDKTRCDLKVSIARDPKTGICTADVDGKVKVDKGKLDHRVVWTLDTSSVTGYTYEFSEKDGILIVHDKDGQATKGGWGDGNASISPARHDQFHVKNKNGKKDSKVFYLPVIVELDKSGDVNSVCVPYDPIIYNGGP